jgi:histidine ammonia-lyase
MIEIDGDSLSLEDLSSVSRGKASVVLAPRAAVRVDAARAVIDRAVAENRVVYGVTTGFGKFADVVIPREKLGQLQLNLVRSHAAGTGRPLAAPAVRAVMLLRAN